MVRPHFREVAVATRRKAEAVTSTCTPICRARAFAANLPTPLGAPTPWLVCRQSPIEPRGFEPRHSPTGPVGAEKPAVTRREEPLAPVCGPERIRTADLTRARGALYQLSYWPSDSRSLQVEPRRRVSRSPGGTAERHKSPSSFIVWSSSAARSALCTFEVVKSPLVLSMIERATSVSRRKPYVIPSG